MKKCKWLVVLIMLLPSFLKGQKPGKPVIDTTVLGKWPQPALPLLSPDGQYAVYRVNNHPAGSNSMVVLSTRKEGWCREIEAADRFDPYFFSSDSRRLIYKKQDTLYFLYLGNDSVESVAGVRSYKVSRSSNMYTAKEEWLAYQLLGEEKQLVIQKLSGSKILQIAGVEDYMFNKSGNVLLVTCTVRQQEKKGTMLYWVGLDSVAAKQEIWSGTGLKEKCFSPDGKQLAFIVIEQGESAVWYYNTGMQQAVIKVDKNTVGRELGWQISGGVSFSAGNRWLFFEWKQPKRRKAGNGSPLVEVWSYRDRVLQPRQFYRQQQEGNRSYRVIIPVEGDTIVRLEYAEEEVLLMPTGGFDNGGYIVVQENSGGEYWWPHDSGAWYLVALKDGKRKRITANGRLCSFPAFSPAGKYFMFWDIPRQGYYSYNCETGRLVNTTASVEQVAREYPSAAINYPELPSIGWFPNDEAFLFCDSYDIWKLDPAGKRSPVNITKGYGRRKSIRFRPANEEENAGTRRQVYTEHDTMLLVALDMNTKYNGFYRQCLDGRSGPELLTMGPYTYYKTTSLKPHYYALHDGMQPVQAANDNSWIVERSAPTEAPNYFYTRDFKQFTALSQLAPQKAYNWLTTELVKWKLPGGREGHGVLYKPENFDSTQKYPLIFNCYQQLSHRLYEFPYPQYTASNINIPWFVSRGYLVFTPDIHYTVGSRSGKTVGESALEAVTSAARHLRKLPFVDGRRMAIQGHSFGGGETNYIVTHTGMFAAAAEAAGDSDPLMAYLTLVPLVGEVEWYAKQEGAEIGQGYYGKEATPWRYPELFRRGSALLSAGNTTTPLLIMHNRRDNQVSFRQGVAMYMALRRLGKPVWMLQYDQGDHSAGPGRKDYTIRLTQFFDHYLKGAPAPRWMTQGVPAELKGIEARYEPDPDGSCGKTCKVCNIKLGIGK